MFSYKFWEVFKNISLIEHLRWLFSVWYQMRGENSRNPLVLSLFSDEAFHKKQISLLSKGKIICEENNLVQTFNIFFNNILKNLQLQNEKI